MQFNIICFLLNCIVIYVTMEATRPLYYYPGSKQNRKWKSIKGRKSVRLIDELPRKLIGSRSDLNKVVTSKTEVKRNSLIFDWLLDYRGYLKALQMYLFKRNLDLIVPTPESYLFACINMPVIVVCHNNNSISLRKTL